MKDWPHPDDQPLTLIDRVLFVAAVTIPLLALGVWLLGLLA